MDLHPMNENTSPLTNPNRKGYNTYRDNDQFQKVHPKLTEAY